jgi:serine/threonine protein kinase
MKFSKYRGVELNQEPEKNVIRIEGDEFFLEYMDTANVARLGANSSIFRAVARDGERSYVVKFCRYPLDSKQPREQMRILRFKREIEALARARDSEFSDCVVRTIDDGVFDMRTAAEGQRLGYYVMEEADSDLGSYLEENELSFPQQVFLCAELVRILKGLHAVGIYHRDIKATNILMYDNRPIFSDLGLISYRDVDEDLDKFSERIGPVGFLSPEATNKCLGLRGKKSFSFDCRIDEKSDIFQLGQVFWLVLQSEVATGHLDDSDVKFPHIGVLSTVIHPMLQYGKERRASLSMVELALQPVLKEVALA